MIFKIKTILTESFKVFRIKTKVNARGISVLYFLFMTLLVVNFGCCSYSFTGASVPEHLKTISIPVADDRSGSGEPDLRELFTNKLTQKFIDDNTLRVADRINANASLDCIISSLSDAPAVVSAGAVVETRRITLSIQVVYKDLVKRKNIFERTFSDYGDYPAQGSIVERRAAIEAALEKITEDILLATVSGW